MKIDSRFILTLLLLLIGFCQSEHHAHDHKLPQKGLAQTSATSFLCSDEKKKEFLAKSKDCLASTISYNLFQACTKAYLAKYARCNKGCDSGTKAVWDYGGANYCFKTANSSTNCYNAHRDLFPDCDPYSGPPEPLPTTTKTCSDAKKKEYYASLPSCIDHEKQKNDYAHYGNCIYSKTVEYEGCNLECDTDDKHALWFISRYIATFQGDDNVVHAMAAARYAFPKCALSRSLTGSGDRKIIQNDGTQLCIDANNNIVIKKQGEYCFASDIPPPPPPPPAPTPPPTQSKTGTAPGGPPSSPATCVSMFKRIDVCPIGNVLKFHACSFELLKYYSGCDGCSEELPFNFSNWAAQLTNLIFKTKNKKSWYFDLLTKVQTKLKEVKVQFPQCEFVKIPTFNIPKL